MRCWETDADIAGGLASSEEGTRFAAVAAFVRLFTFSAPTELALSGAGHPAVCAAYRGDQPLVRFLLDALPIPEEVSLAWRIALLEGEDLSGALRAFDERYGERIRKLLKSYCRDPEDVYQHVLLELMTRRDFRRSFFGKYSGQGKLLSYLRTVFVREAVRESGRQQRFWKSTDLLDEMPGRREPAPEEVAERHEFRAGITETFRELNEDSGLVPFLLQQCANLRSDQAARVLRLNENAVRQRTFRFRIRFREVWKKLRGPESEPFAPCLEPDE